MEGGGYECVVSAVCAQIAAVTTQLRLEITESSHAFRAPPVESQRLLLAFDKARHAAVGRGRDGDEPHILLTLLQPFLDTISCEDMSGVATQRALCAVSTLLSSTSLWGDEAPQAIGAVGNAAINCRFEVTDPAADEVVLLCIVQLLYACVASDAGEHLSDEVGAPK